MRIKSTLVAASLFLLGCSSTGQEEVAETPREWSTFDSPLAEVSGLPRSEEEQVQQYEEYERQLGELMVACMISEGFEFSPGETIQTIGVGFGADLTEAEYVEQYGFGMVSGYLEAAKTPLVDENAEYLQTLSGQEFTAYNEALYGLESPEGSNDQDPLSFTIGGCEGAAYEQTEPPVWSSAEFLSLEEEIDERVAADPESAAIRELWGSCASNLGFSDIQSIEEASDLAQVRLLELLDQAPALGDITEEGLDAFGPTEREAWERGLQYERDVAAAAYGCEGVTREREMVLRFEIETAVLQERGLL